MDFASLMKAQISKGKDTAATSTTPTAGSAASKYLRRSEAEAQREAAYLADQKKREQERQERADRKRKADEEDAERERVREEKRRKLKEESRLRRIEDEKEEERKRRKRLGLPELPEPAENGEDDDEQTEEIAEEELLVKLRNLGEPEQLEGESHEQRLRRYYRVLGPKKSRSAVSEVKTYPGPIPTTIEPVPGSEMIVPAKPPTDPAAKRYLYRQMTSYFTMVLSEWEDALAKRTAEVKASYSGKAASNAMVQAREHLRPLYRKLEKGDLESDLLAPIIEIIHAAQQRRYVDANDGYLRLSIGKAAWPIGVTMVGIHERSAREKLHETSGDKTAHIMSDEVTRKYLQALKRLLSFAQTRWPPEDMRQLMG